MNRVVLSERSLTHHSVDMVYTIGIWGERDLDDIPTHSDSVRSIPTRFVALAGVVLYSAWVGLLVLFVQHLDETLGTTS